MVALAEAYGVALRDVRKPPPRSDLHFFTGTIERVNCLKVAMLGTDSAVGKRTTAWLMVDALQAAGYRAEMIGTGQTAFLQLESWQLTAMIAIDVWKTTPFMALLILAGLFCCNGVAPLLR